MEAESNAPYLLRYRQRRARNGEVDGRRGPLSQRGVRTRDHGAVQSPPKGWLEPTSVPDIATSPVPDGGDGAIEMHLVRHGETQSYLADAGLTPRGTWQSRRLGLALAGEVRDGETVLLLAAPTARAAQTADQVRLGLEDGLEARGRAATVLGPEPADQFRNFQVWTPAGLLDPTCAAGEYRAAMSRQEPMRPGERPLWQLELSRFWVLQSGGGDPIEYWMTHPLMAFEPAAAVVRRFWSAAVQLCAGGGRAARVVCCTHSGPMRAFATWALGHDAGEPFNTEQVRVRVWPDQRRAMVTYRGRAQEINDPPAGGAAAWWDS